MKNVSNNRALMLLLFIVVTIFPELIGEEIKNKIQPFLKDRYFYIVGGVGIILTVVYFFANEDNEGVKSDSSKFRKDKTLDRENSNQNIDSFSRRYQTVGSNRESWLKRTFGMEPITAILIADKIANWKKDANSLEESKPPVEYENEFINENGSNNLSDVEKEAELLSDENSSSDIQYENETGEDTDLLEDLIG